MEIEEVEKIAKDVLKKRKKHLQQMILEKQNGSVDLVMLGYDKEDKDKMLNKLREMILSTGIKKYFFVTEAWKSEDIFQTPSKADDRKEILMISEFRKDMKNKLIILSFKRENDNIVFTDRKMMKSGKEAGLHSRFNFFLEDSFDEYMTKVRADESLKYIDDNVVKKVTEKAREFFKDDGITEEMVKDTLTNMVKKGKIGLKKKPKKKNETLDDGVKNDK